MSLIEFTQEKLVDGVNTANNPFGGSVPNNVCLYFNVT